MTDSVAIFTKAAQMLAEADTIQKTKELKDLALTARDWAIRKGLGESAVRHAQSYALRAERKMGEMLKDTERQKPGQYKQSLNGNQSEPFEIPPTLAELGLSKRESSRAELIAGLPEDAFEEIENGNITAHEAIKKVKIEKRQEEIKQQKEAIETGSIELPQGKYEVVVIDPPWNYGREYDPDGSRVANPYPEMSQEELLQMEIPFAPDAVCLLWTTHAFIFDAKELLNNWGFDYKALLIWDKEKMGMGYWLRMQCEFCLVGIKGKPIWENRSWRDIIREPRREHSRKPEVFYKMVEGITVGRRLDFFSRENREGWDGFGNDRGKFNDLA